MNSRCQFWNSNSHIQQIHTYRRYSPRSLSFAFEFCEAMAFDKKKQNKTKKSFNREKKNI